MRAMFLAATAGLLLATSALAANCPAQMKAIDAALAANPTLTEVQMKVVQLLRAEGEALHAAGKHAESEAALAWAREILGVTM